MPEFTTGYKALMEKASGLLMGLRHDIRNREKELQSLREEERRLSALANGRGGMTGARARTTTQPRTAGRRKRADWQAVLGKLPKQFKASDIRKFAEVSSKKPSEIFAGISRWIQGGSVKRKTRGVYEKK